MKLTAAQRHALEMIAVMGDVSQDRRRRAGLRLGENTLEALLVRGLIDHDEVACGDGSTSRYVYVLTADGRAVLKEGT